MIPEQHAKIKRAMEKLIKQMRDELTSGNLQTKIALKRLIRDQEKLLDEHKLAYFQLVEGSEPMDIPATWVQQ